MATPKPVWFQKRKISDGCNSSCHRNRKGSAKEMVCYFKNRHQKRFKHSRLGTNNMKTETKADLEITDRYYKIMPGQQENTCR